MHLHIILFLIFQREEQKYTKFIDPFILYNSDIKNILTQVMTLFFLA